MGPRVRAWDGARRTGRGGIGIAPGANISYVTGHGIFEATHGTAPKYASQDKVNPGSLLLSDVLMFEHLGWEDAVKDIYPALEATIATMW